MGEPARLLSTVAEVRRQYPIPVPKRPDPGFAFHSLVLTKPRSVAKERTLPLAVSLIFHSALVATAILVPIFFLEDVLPAPGQAVQAFFATPADVAPPPPPPPPPPPAGIRAKVHAAPVVRPPEPGRFVAPVETPERLPATESILGVEGGVPGGVEGGVPGGVVGGVVGGLPREAPAPPPAVVRVGGNIRAPKLVHEVKPVYPGLAIQARLSAIVILEAHVGVDGRVQSVRILRGAPVFDDAAVEAVKQWRYQPLLLNGQPTEFVLTVTVSFNLIGPTAGQR